MKWMGRDGARRYAFSALPIWLMLTVAGAQQIWVHHAHLSPWKGGGFGMFASTDGGARRHLEITLYAADHLPSDIRPAPRFRDAVQKAEELPTDRRWKRLARLLASDHAAGAAASAAPITKARFRLWRTTFQPDTLEPSLELIRESEIEIEP